MFLSKLDSPVIWAEGILNGLSNFFCESVILLTREIVYSIFFFIDGKWCVTSVRPKHLGWLLVQTGSFVVTVQDFSLIRTSGAGTFCYEIQRLLNCVVGTIASFLIL